MKATNILLDDDRGFVSVCIQRFHAALAPSPRVDAEAAAPSKPGWFERFDRWAARARQREREAYLAGSKDIFELEARLKNGERQPYY